MFLSQRVLQHRIQVTFRPISPSTRFSQPSLTLFFIVPMSAFESGRQFFVDPSTTQPFYHEPTNGVYSPWTPLPLSDFHSQKPGAHNVSVFFVYVFTLLIWHLVAGLDLHAC